MGRRAIDMTGQTFGRLKVLRIDHVEGNGRYHWLCRCSCGERAVVNGSHLRSGNTKSCGCLRREHMAKIGRTNKKDTDVLDTLRDAAREFRRNNDQVMADRMTGAIVKLILAGVRA